MKVHKLKLEFSTGTPKEYKLPEGATILTSGLQNSGVGPGDLCIWFTCEPENRLEDRTLVIYGTGHEMKEDGFHRYISTIFDRGFVWHVFELLEV